MKKFPVFYFLPLFLLLVSCKKEPDDPQVVLPSNFAAPITINEGEVSVLADADNANFYTTTYFDTSDSTTVESSDGISNYTFTASGSYTVRSRAHTTYSDYIEISNTIVVTLPTTGGVDGLPTTGYTTPISYADYTLVWNDEFDGTELSSDWTHEIGTGNWGWGNNELQYYLRENTEVKGGYLIITAKEETYSDRSYTSSRIKTQGAESFSQGRIDIRAALPEGQGIWPALWMLGDNITSVGWPKCGEIDIMELIGGEGTRDRTVHGTIHWDENGSNANYGGSNSLSSGKFKDEFHVFSIVWDASSIKWLRDDIQYHVADITATNLSAFQGQFFFIFNVAVGGNWPGSPDASTVFPQKMAVDYVRVFQ